ncbi:MAG: bifunctional adenosylcobinamide kinase/adenosylcobinamide-phosphate guanylyltransferase [Bacteroides sp.]|nr:bifunctional adenosylcobinamide kinase/adenosylcobinamide-phosphate guanylyltransferase [Eubacterium sp.]MCM1417857.1 bifunctional adenosylcobinamide kinase/adenosylcobinamide-phosphate guanylyltransferase [Roseburia sp.]MCM1461296.1 bifunctional adenosylcobinamide kinase/adenosylcobinamide-phosphate guanylyltransferase [Bacteroides sp.]
MTTLITGGAKCGKSRYAEKILDGFAGDKIYIATMRPYGDEALRAIERHRRLRAGKGFRTVEKYTDLDELDLPEGCGVLLECTANLCANEMFRDEGVFDPVDKIIRGFDFLGRRAKTLVIVTNEVGSDGVAYARETADYIKYMGEINRRAAAKADRVIELVYGIPVVLKGAVIE